MPVSDFGFGFRDHFETKKHLLLFHLLAMSKASWKVIGGRRNAMFPSGNMAMKLT